MHPRTSCLSQVNMQVILSAEMLLAMMEYLEKYCKLKCLEYNFVAHDTPSQCASHEVAAIVHAG